MCFNLCCLSLAIKVAVQSSEEEMAEEMYCKPDEKCLPLAVNTSTPPSFDELMTDLKEMSVTDSESDDEEEEEVTVVYRIGEDSQPFQGWMEKNMPSEVRWDGADFIGVRFPSYRLKEIYTKHLLTVYDVPGLLQAWKHTQASGVLISKHLLFELAQRFGVTAGKWMLIPVQTGIKVDVLWSKVAEAIALKTLPSSYAKVSTIKPPCHRKKKHGDNNSHVICIYNENFLDRAEVETLEKGIRSIGLRGRLCYKPDVFTYCGIYSHNKWKIPPVIYISNYDIVSGQSKIVEV